MDDILEEMEEMVLGDEAPSRVAKVALAKAEEALRDSEEKNPLVEIFFHKDIRVVGTVKDPLFCASDVAGYLGDTHYITKLKEYVTAESTDGETYIQTRAMKDKMGRSKKMLLLTENGLYRYLLRSNAPKAVEFQSYTYKVLKAERDRVVDAAQLAVKISSNRYMESAAQCRMARSDMERAMRAANDAREEVRRLRAQNTKRETSARAKEDARILALEEENANRTCFETAHRF